MWRRRKNHQSKLVELDLFNFTWNTLTPRFIMHNISGSRENKMAFCHYLSSFSPEDTDYTLLYSHGSTSDVPIVDEPHS